MHVFNENGNITAKITSKPRYLIKFLLIPKIVLQRSYGFIEV